MMIAIDAIRERYAELLVGPAGVNVQPGQSLRVVSPRVRDDRLLAAIAGAGEALGARHDSGEPQEHAATVCLTCPADIDAVPSLDPRDALDEDGRWRAQLTICAVPTEEWAQSLHPGERGALDRLWLDLAVACGLVEPDDRTRPLDDATPRWVRRHETLEGRVAWLNRLQLDRVRFLGGGSDLVVGLLPTSRWVGPRATSQSGVVFVPNVPCDEIFTAPDPARAEGHALARQAPVVDGEAIDELTLEFQPGRPCIVTAAGDGAERLTNLVTGAGLWLGEVALVEKSGLVARAGRRSWGHPLLDENTASHVALGAAFPGTYGRSDAERVPSVARHRDVTLTASAVYGYHAVDLTASPMARSVQALPISILARAKWSGTRDRTRIPEVVDVLRIAMAVTRRPLCALVADACPPGRLFGIEDHPLVELLPNVGASVSAPTEQQRELLAALRDNWAQAPDLRLGQLLLNLANTREHSVLASVADSRLREMIAADE
jgi:leucyl aminopeptidase (aminopeptidase T)